jgi:ribonuclease HI
VQELLSLRGSEEQIETRQKEVWKPPPEGWVKVNSDGSFDGCVGCGAGAAVIRDHQGAVVAAQARWYGPMQEALVAEAAAARDGLELARQLGMAKIIFECDNSVLVSALKSTSRVRSIIAGLCHDIQELGKMFSSFKVCCVRREANSEPDRCVKEASCESSDQLWLNCIPMWLREAAASECNPALE